jgi:hypothetical protein
LNILRGVSASCALPDQLGHQLPGRSSPASRENFLSSSTGAFIVLFQNYYLISGVHPKDMDFLLPRLIKFQMPVMFQVTGELEVKKKRLKSVFFPK